MSSLFGFAEKILSTATSGGGSSEARKAGGQEYNSPHHSQQTQGGYDTSDVLSHADDVDDEGKEYIANAVKHVHDNPQQHNEEVDQGDLAKYGPMIFSALSSLGGSKSKSESGSGFDVGTLLSGGLGEGGGNKLLALVVKQAGSLSGGGEDKQSAMNGAAMTLTKLVAQKQLTSFIGGSNSGGLDMLDIGKTLLKSRFG